MGTVKMYAKADPESKTVVHETMVSAFEGRGWVVCDDDSPGKSASADDSKGNDSKSATPPAATRTGSGADSTKKEEG